MECKKCGGHMTVDYSEVFTSIPPMYKAKCDNCGSVDYVYCHECSDITKEEERQILGHEPLTFEQMKEIEAMNLQHDWNKLRNEYAGLAMQAIISNQELLEEHTNFIETDGKRGFFDYGGMKKGNDRVAKLAVAYADALIDELRRNKEE